jgi:hypothetical protein
LNVYIYIEREIYIYRFVLKEYSGALGARFGARGALVGHLLMKKKKLRT